MKVANPMKIARKQVGILLVAAVTAVSIWKLTGPALPGAPSPPDTRTSVGTDPQEDTAGPMMLELYTPYCPSCLQMAPVVDRLAGACPQNGVQVRQYDISTAENEHLMKELEIQAVPTFVFIDEAGMEVSRLVGKQSAETIESRLADIGGAACADRS